ncbi:Uncharacterized protein OS=Singulisphaera acidiphila (strain ATCC BAA-1392 / DSM 18658 / VKM B-2454 / MOB10) GN=Sinac_4631 PE=4 SV=1: Imm31 [Gemmata massiliana]|uniref:Uncharacterized protein n=1 Tax=Gemmata massiliana TaxID=1210884 RepID=A0A6P2DJS3_9BACT|nr:Imm51 family immunity protein [Gemmata massiliana]VTS00563.1 Uncharacterized protein OS=Singulisphaera acidiphila (strain ATCC BAA-1392 / DSM 18658 / VKM B-2454 / MOB10) GN=Sinac_4631 PE=4 SV=1: Imm31 [Gemmata massiliana]
MPTNDDIAPVRLLEEGGTFSLVREEFDGWYGAFEDAGYEGGGRGWHGVADALIRLKAPLLKKKVRFDPEASTFVAHGTDREVVLRLAKLMKEATADPAVLREALANGEPDLME